MNAEADAREFVFLAGVGGLERVYDFLTGEVLFFKYAGLRAGEINGQAGLFLLWLGLGSQIIPGLLASLAGA